MSFKIQSLKVVILMCTTRKKTNPKHQGIGRRLGGGIKELSLQGKNVSQNPERQANLERAKIHVSTVETAREIKEWKN